MDNFDMYKLAKILFWVAGLMFLAGVVYLIFIA